MAYTRFIQDDLEQAIRAINNLRSEFDNRQVFVLHMEMDEQTFFLEQELELYSTISSQLDRIEEVLRDLRTAMRTKEPEDSVKETTVYLIATTQTVVGQIKDLTASFASTTTSTPPARKDFKRWLKDNVFPRMKHFLGWLWQLVAGLLTPKEWKMAGGVNIPGLASASLEITFGI